MKTVTVVTLLAAIVAVSTSVNGAAVSTESGSASNVDLAAALKMYYKGLKNIMPCGYEPYGLPVLAPLSVDFWPFNFTGENYSFVGNVSGLLISGLNNFNILKMETDQETSRTSFDIIFNQVHMVGEYMKNGWFTLAGFPIQDVYSGLLDMKLIDYRLVGDITLGPNPSNASTLIVSDLNLKFFVGDVVMNNFDYLLDDISNNFVNRILRETVLYLSQELRPVVTEFAKEHWVPLLDEILEKLSMDQLVADIVDVAEPLDNAQCSSA